MNLSYIATLAFLLAVLIPSVSAAPISRGVFNAKNARKAHQRDLFESEDHNTTQYPSEKDLFNKSFWEDMVSNKTYPFPNLPEISANNKYQDTPYSKLDLAFLVSVLNDLLSDDNEPNASAVLEALVSIPTVINRTKKTMTDKGRKRRDLIDDDTGLHINHHRRHHQQNDSFEVLNNTQMPTVRRRLLQRAYQDVQFASPVHHRRLHAIQHNPLSRLHMRRSADLLQQQKPAKIEQTQPATTSSLPVLEVPVVTARNLTEVLNRMQTRGKHSKDEPPKKDDCNGGLFCSFVHNIQLSFEDLEKRFKHSS